MKDASNIFYCCRKTVITNGERDVKFLTYVGPHPLMDTGTRDMVLKHGAFVEDFTYDKWQQFVANGTLESVKVEVANNDEEEEDK